MLRVLFAKPSFFFGLWTLLVINSSIVVAEGVLDEPAASLFPPAFVKALTSVELQDTTRHYPLSTLEYLPTVGRKSVEAIAGRDFENRWQEYGEEPVVRNGVPFNDGQKTHWFRLNVNKAGDSESVWWLVVEWPVLDYVRLHVYDHKTEQWRHDQPMGARFSAKERAILDRNFILPLDLSKGSETTVFVELRSPSNVLLPIAIWHKDDYVIRNQLSMMFLGILLGSVGAMVIYNLSIFSVLRDRAYLYYSIYAATVLFYLMCTLGVGSLYFWGESEWLSQRAFPVSVSLSCLTAILFGREFMRIRQSGGWPLHLSNFLIAGWSVATVLILFVDLSTAAVLFRPLILMTTAVGFLLPIYLWYQGNEQAKYFVFAWSLLVLGAAAMSLAMMGMIRITPALYYTHVISFSLELMLLAYALANRISTERRQRLQAQAETLDVQKTLNDELEDQVKKRTEQLRETLDRLERANEELTELSVTDSTTKLYNRRYFDCEVVEECRRAYRSQHSLAVLLLDIDHFKKINDNFGHAVGDECLKVIGATLKAQIKRSGDLVARYGGEEFVCILPATSREDAKAFAEQCRVQVSQIEFECNGVKVKLTASVGVAAHIPESEGGYMTLVEEADKALYEAKSNGRDCVVCASKSNKIKFGQFVG